MTRTGLLDRRYAGGPLVVATWDGRQFPLADGVDIGDLVTGNQVIAETEHRTGYPPEVVVSVRRKP